MGLRNLSENTELADEDEMLMEGTGYCALLDTEGQILFDAKGIQASQAEAYLEQSLNHLEQDMADKLFRLAYQWKEEQVTDYPDAGYAPGLQQATEKELINYIELLSIHIYRNPYDEGDAVLGASIYCCPAWDEENQMEIIIRGKEVLEVRDFCGYGASAIWDAPKTNS